MSQQRKIWASLDLLRGNFRPLVLPPGGSLERGEDQGSYSWVENKWESEKVKKWQFEILISAQLTSYTCDIDDGNRLKHNIKLELPPNRGG